MVRKKVRTQILLFKKIHGKKKGKNWILTSPPQKKNHIVWQKVRAQSLLLKKKNIQTNTL